MADQPQRQRKRRRYADVPSPRLWKGATKEAKTLVSWASIYALCRHYGIDSTAPTSFMDLAIALALEYESETLKKSWRSGLFKKYGIDPLDKKADLLLARQLTQKYVWPQIDLQPALARGDEWGTGWSTADLAKLALAVKAIAIVLEGEGKKPAPNAIATALQDKKILPKAIGETMCALLDSHRNQMTNQKAVPSNKWLRTTLIPAVLKPGKPSTKLEVQLCTEVLPLVDKAIAMTWQIDDVSERRKAAVEVPT